MKKPTKNYRITSLFGPRVLLGVAGTHTGIDLGAIIAGVDGDDIYAIADGIIKASTVNSGGLSVGYGSYVVIEHSGYCSLSGHLSARSVKVGDKVKAGQVIGKMGKTGHSTATHLHFEIRKCAYVNFWDKRYVVDPKVFLESEAVVEKPAVVIQKPVILTEKQTLTKLVQDKTGLSDASMAFLGTYRGPKGEDYSLPLLIKLANAMK